MHHVKQQNLQVKQILYCTSTNGTIMADTDTRI